MKYTHEFKCQRQAFAWLLMALPFLALLALAVRNTGLSATGGLVGLGSLALQTSYRVLFADRPGPP